MKKNICLVLSASSLSRLLSNNGIYIKNKLYDLTLINYIVNNYVYKDYSIFGELKIISHKIYKEYILLFNKIKENKQEDFFFYLNILKDLFIFLELRGINIDTTIVSKFIDQNKKYIFNNKVYPNFNNLSFSGRVYTNNPSITNIPKAEKRILIPNNSSNVLYSIDFNQLELRVLYSLLNNKELIDGCNRGLDFHSITASIVLQKDISSITDEDRKEGKKYNFYILYGDPDKNNKISKYFNDLLVQRRLMLKKFIDEGKVITPFNRILHITNEMEEKSIFNFFIQSSASDLVFKFLLKILGKINIDNIDIVIYNIIHDELVFEIPKEKIKILNEFIDISLDEIKKENSWLKTDLTVARKEYS